MAPHLARAQSARKDIGYAYFITHTHARTHARTHTHTHTHTHKIHVLLVVVGTIRKKPTDQHAEEKRWIFSFD